MTYSGLGESEEFSAHRYAYRSDLKGKGHVGLHRKSLSFLQSSLPRQIDGDTASDGRIHPDERPVEPADPQSEQRGYLVVCAAGHLRSVGTAIEPGPASFVGKRGSQRHDFSEIEGEGSSP